MKKEVKKKLPMADATALLLAVAIAAAACSGKDGEGDGGSATYCYTCVSASTWTGPGAPEPTAVIEEVCGLTEEDARNTERAGTYTATSSSGSATKTTVMTCARKKMVKKL